MEEAVQTAVEEIGYTNLRVKQKEAIYKVKMCSFRSQQVAAKLLLLHIASSIQHTCTCNIKSLTTFLQPVKLCQESPDLSSALSQCKSRGERSDCQTTKTTVNSKHLIISVLLQLYNNYYIIYNYIHSSLT